MRSAISYALIAIIGGVVGAAVTQSGTIYDKVTRHFASEPQEPAGFWSTPAIEGYGKIHYEPDAAFKPVPGLSNKIVFPDHPQRWRDDRTQSGTGARRAGSESLYRLWRSGRSAEVCGFGYR